MHPSERIRIREVRTLSDDWYVLKKTTFDYQLRNGSWKTLSRETYDRGNGATILLFNREKRTVLLTRQFRLPAYVTPKERVGVTGSRGDGVGKMARIKKSKDQRMQSRQQGCLHWWHC